MKVFLEENHFNFGIRSSSFCTHAKVPRARGEFRSRPQGVARQARDSRHRHGSVGGDTAWSQKITKIDTLGGVKKGRDFMLHFVLNTVLEIVLKREI